jgi:hypothetical protein
MRHRPGAAIWPGPSGRDPWQCPPEIGFRPKLFTGKSDMKNVITALLAATLAVAAILFISIPGGNVTIANSNVGITSVK